MKPYQAASKSAQERATQLKILSNGTERTVTPEEFWNIVKIKDEDSAIEAAEALVEGSKGASSKAAILIERRNDILAQYTRMESAKEEFKAKSAEREKAFQEQTVAQRTAREQEYKQRAERFKSENESAAKKYPQWFAPQDGDEEGNKRLQKGTQFADTIFGDMSKVPPEQAVKMHSAARMKIAGFDRLAFKFQQASAKLASLQKEIDSLKGNGPGSGGVPGRRSEKTQTKSWSDEIDELDRSGPVR